MWYRSPRPGSTRSDTPRDQWKAVESAAVTMPPIDEDVPKSGSSTPPPRSER